MAWYDDPRNYYREIQPEEPLTQGDIVIAPTTIIQVGTSDSDMIGPSELDETRRTTLWMAAAEALPAAPAFSAETRWGVAMVIPHPCAMEKEWNERIEDLIHVGYVERDAVAAASADDTLDPFVTLAPILSYDAIPAEKHRGVQTNQRLGSFPVCEAANVPASFVDFNRLATVHHSVVPRARRIAGLTALAIAHLHHSLVMHFAYRGYAGLAKIEEAVGHVITDLQVTRRAKGRIVVNFLLDNAETLTMESQDAEEPGQARERAPRG